MNSAPFSITLIDKYGLTIPEKYVRPFVAKNQKRVKVVATNNTKIIEFYAALKRLKTGTYRIFFSNEKQKSLDLNIGDTFTLYASKKNMTNRKLLSKDELTVIINNNGIQTWGELIDFVKTLPYGRNSNRTDFELVITEKKGSCSSKHSLLKKVANLNNIPNIKLILGIYKMTKNNTPNIGNVLIDNSIDFMPEAHCYLKIEGIKTDITTFQSDFEKLEKDIIQELEIQPEQVAEFKVEYHKDFIKNWILENNVKMDFDEIWQIREKCIMNLTEKASVQHGL